MKNKWKYIGALAMAAVAIFMAVNNAQAATADEYDVQTVISNYRVFGAVDSNLTATAGIFNATKHEEVTVMCELKNHNTASTTNNVFRFAFGQESGVWDTNKLWTITVPCKGTATNRYLTNWNVGAYGYFKVLSISNGDTNELGDGILTNVTVKVAVKPTRWGNK
jgi:hypothetical protein